MLEKGEAPKFVPCFAPSDSIFFNPLCVLKFCPLHQNLTLCAKNYTAGPPETAYCPMP